MIVGACLGVFYVLWVLYFVHLSNHNGRKIEGTLKEVFLYTSLGTGGGFIATLWIFLAGSRDKTVIAYLIVLGAVCAASIIAMVACSFCGENREETLVKIAKARLSGKRYELSLDNIALIDKCRNKYAYAIAELLVVEKQKRELHMNKKHACAWSDVPRLEEKDAKTLVKCLKLVGMPDALADLGKLRLALKTSEDVREALKELSKALEEQLSEGICKHLNMEDVALDFCEISKYDLEIVETVALLFEYTDADTNEKKELLVGIGIDDVEKMAAEIVSKRRK